MAFDPLKFSDSVSYRSWCARKFAAYADAMPHLPVEIADPLHISVAERGELLRRCAAYNFVVYAVDGAVFRDKTVVKRLGEQLGLERLDGNLYADHDRISALQVAAHGRQQDYIPYTDRPLSWHTDGYYNSAAQRIRAFIMHCVSAAPVGGENQILDHEIAYLQLYDLDPEHIRALTAPDAMTIPANVEGDEELRGAETGPVFLHDTPTGTLHMRYTARKHHVAWRRDAATQAARHALETITDRTNPYVFTHRLQAGHGIICNNVLHNRSAFHDDASRGECRLLYRARYYDRIDPI